MSQIITLDLASRMFENSDLMACTTCIGFFTNTRTQGFPIISVHVHAHVEMLFGCFQALETINEKTASMMDVKWSPFITFLVSDQGPSSQSTKIHLKMSTGSQ